MSGVPGEINGGGAGSVWCDYGVSSYLAGEGDSSGSGYNSIYSAHPIGNLQPASQLVLYCDSNASNMDAFLGTTSGLPDSPRHQKHKNMVFVDGHVESAVVIVIPVCVQDETINLLNR